MSKSFVHLHCHTSYSLLDGAARIDPMIQAVVDDGQPAVGITDHGNMYGIVPFYKECKKQGINPILGIEAYQAKESQSERPVRKSKVDDDGGGESLEKEKMYYHLLLLAESTEGYHNLIKLSSDAFLNGYYYKPRTSWEVLEKHHEGLIATTSCLGGQVLQAFMKDDYDGGLKVAARLQDIFGRDNLFVEVQDHGIPEQIRTNPMLMKLAKQINAPLVATNDTHYVHAKDAEPHDCLLAIQTGSKVSDPNRFKFSSDQHYMKTAEEMRYIFREVPQACDSTLWIAERATAEIEFGTAELPKFPVPEGYTESSYLAHLVGEGAADRYGSPIPADVEERIAYETSVVERMGFLSYFLIVWDLMRHAREVNIRYGPGRGSDCGSILLYCLQVTEIDPIKYDLMFERFLNPDRVSMPDADIDIDTRYRDEMVRYTAEMYGEDRVAQIITYSTIKARAAVRDAARVLDKPYYLGDKIAKAMPPLLFGRPTPLHACMKEEEDHLEGYKQAAKVRRLYDDDPNVREIIDVALGLEDLQRQDGIHAAAVVIAGEPLTNHVPVQRKPIKGQPGPLVTQYDMHAIEELGLLKMDYLGLRNLDVITDTVEMIHQRTGETLDMNTIPKDDPETMRLLQQGKSIGVFQLEGVAMRELMRLLQPTTFEDVCALIALYRPGPMAAGMHTDYANVKNGRKPLELFHEDAGEILADTQGLMIYQEKMMAVSQKFAGYTLSEADSLRKACGKKKPELMAKERDKFIAGCIEQGYEAIAESLFATIEEFANYAFPKAHAFGYGFISWQTAYLKTHYTAEYLSALMTSVKDKYDKLALYLNECRHMGVKVYAPDVNRSFVDFVPTVSETESSIPFALSAIKNVGEAGVTSIIEARKDGPFTDFYDFCNRVDLQLLNKKVLDSLIRAGGFDSLGYARKGLLDTYEPIVEATKKRRGKEDAGLFSLFDDDQETMVVVSTDEFSPREKLKWEKEIIGLYVTDHPLNDRPDVLRKASHSIIDLQELDDGAKIVVGGIIASSEVKNTKKGDLMAVFQLEDPVSTLECIVFPKSMADVGHLVKNDVIVLVTGRLEKVEDRVKMFVSDIRDMDTVDPLMAKLTLHLNPSVDQIPLLKTILGRNPGDSPVIIQTGTTKLQLPPVNNVDLTGSVIGELRLAFGFESIKPD